jgi:hypothetical protein
MKYLWGIYLIGQNTTLDEDKQKNKQSKKKGKKQKAKQKTKQDKTNK